MSGRAFEAQYAEHKGIELKAAEIIGLKRRGGHLAPLLWRRYVDRVARGLATVFRTPGARNRHGDASGVRSAAWLWKE